MAITDSTETEYKNWKAEEVKVIGDRAVRFRDVCVHEFTMGDVDDIEIYAAQPLYEWSQTECGKWCIENAVELPYWIKAIDHVTWGHRFKIMARLSEQNETYFRLKFNK